VFLDEPHVRIGLGGIAKGYAVDRASKVLEDGGLTSYYVQAGGDLYAHGTKPDGSPWQAGVRDPRGPDGDYFAMLPLRDHAFSTAGDYERSYIVGGTRYHHIIDPHTGHSASKVRSATIIGPTATQTDGMSKTAFVLGPERALEIINRMPEYDAVFICPDGRVVYSNGLRPPAPRPPGAPPAAVTTTPTPTAAGAAPH
jgi:thiamine biosynthesis lipoprotein